MMHHGNIFGSRFVGALGMLVLSPLLLFAQTNSWRGLTPLRSSRADAERALGKPAKEEPWGTKEYKTQEGIVFARFTSKSCESGWDVPVGTLVSLSPPKMPSLGKTADELEFVEGQQYQMTTDVADRASWIDPDKGIAYSVELGPHGDRLDFLIRPVTFIPTRSDNDRRCDGFPPYAPERYYFTLLTSRFINPELSEKDALNVLVADIDNLAAYVLANNGKYTGFVLVYFDGKRPFEFYEEKLMELKSLLRKRRPEYEDKIVFIEGGMREESLAEFHVISKGTPPPAPNPTLPSPQFMRNKVSARNRN